MRTAAGPSATRSGRIASTTSSRVPGAIAARQARRMARRAVVPVVQDTRLSR